MSDSADHGAELRREFTEDDVQIIGEILGDAFSDDPILLWLVNEPRVIEAMFRRFAECLYVPKGLGHIVGDGQGATQWLPPGTRADVPTSQLIATAWQALLANGPKAIGRILKISAFMEEMHPKEPHYYLFAIGVRQGAQGKGFGRKLFEPMLAKCDAEKMPAYLENSKERNLGFYRSHGFEVMGDGPVIPVPGCPPMWPMWRKPR